MTKPVEPTVATLDAGGTNLTFSALRGSAEAVAPFTLPAHGHDLEACLHQIATGFERTVSAAGGVAALSFAFPGPADYDAGIIGDLPNLPAFRGGVPLGPMLEERFKVPVYINNDGDLFAAGEAAYGLLPEVNRWLTEGGSTKRYRNLLGITLGTGFGGGLVAQGGLLRGDNSAAGEIWLVRNKLHPDQCAEEGTSIRAVRTVYAEGAAVPLTAAPEPQEIAAIARGTSPGNQAAALEAFRRLGEQAGDAVANALTLLDGLVVVGGGLAGAADLFLPSLVAELNSTLASHGGRVPRLELAAFNLEDSARRADFLSPRFRQLPVPGSNRSVPYDPVKRTGVGVSRLGTSRAIALGAYAVAIQRLAAVSESAPRI
jgi:glucokinase